MPNPLVLPALNAIVDDEAAARVKCDVLHVAEAFLAGGATFLQFRAKRMSGRRLLETAAALVDRARARGALVIVNDRADIARLAGADGVHVGQTDLAPRDVRAIVGYDAIVGVSTHTVVQLEQALAEPVDYVAIGPVFGSATKATGYDAIGLERVRDAADRAHARGLPLVAIGGVTLSRAAAVRRAGADAVAVIADLLTDGDPEARVREYLRILA